MFSLHRTVNQMNDLNIHYSPDNCLSSVSIDTVLLVMLLALEIDRTNDSTWS